MALTSGRLLEHVRVVLSQTSQSGILNRTVAEVQRVTGARVAYGSYLPPRRAWEQSLLVRTPADAEPLPPRIRSALFAVHRRMARDRASFSVSRAEIPGIFPGAADAVDDLVALTIPIWSRSDRLAGEITIVTDAAQQPGEDERVVVEELARLAEIALENARRVAFARRDQERLQLLAEASVEALWDWNLESGEFWWGGGVQRLLGSDNSPVEHRLEWKYERIDTADRDRVRESFNQALNDRACSAWMDEYRVPRGAGSFAVVQDNGYFLRDASGRAFRAVGATRDITVLRELVERERTARQDAEMANRAKDDFLAILGHELRNPLAPIGTATELLNLRRPEGIDRELGIIQRQTAQLVRLVDDLLDVSRVATGKIELQCRRLEIAEVIQESVETTRSLFVQRKHHLEVRAPVQGLPVEVDPARFAQIMCNLLTNAARYTAPGGRITVEAVGEGRDVRICVSDTGVGIEPDMLSRVFEMFVQERQALDRARGGLGLGLSIVRSLVALHGGSVQAFSDGPGCGSRFTVRLPLAVADPVAEASLDALDAASLASTHPRWRVLVLDDNQDAADMLALYLQNRGHETSEAHDGRAAIVAARDFAPDVVLLDIGLPVMDGYAVARTLRMQPGGDQLRIIAVTGYGQESDRRRALDAGFDAHVVKPVGMVQLHGIIEQLMATPRVSS